MPSSSIVNMRQSSVALAVTRAVLALAYLATFVSASATTK